jgi:hypothetical protein
MSRGVTKHGVNFAGVARKQVKRFRTVAILAACLYEQILEVFDVVINGRAKILIDAVTALDFLNGLMALRRV